MRARLLLAVLALGAAIALVSATQESGAGPRAANAPQRAAASTPRQASVRPAALRPKRERIRGRFGYGRRYTKPRGLTREQLEHIEEKIEEKEENQARPPQPAGPFAGPHDESADAEEGSYPFKPGRRSDDPSIPLPPFPPAGKPSAGTVKVHKAGPGVQAAGRDDTFVMPRNQPVVKGGGLTSTRGEPSWANDGPIVLYTGNWHAHVSQDSGITWDNLRVVDIAAGRPNVNDGFCCDQIAYAADYGDQRLLFWTLLYLNDGTDNTIRVQVYHGGDELVNQVRQCTYDFKAGDFYQPGARAWLDNPRMASTDKWLYMAASVYDQQNQFNEAKIWRIELEQLAQTDCDDPIEVWHYINQPGGVSDGQANFVQGAKDVMYWAYSDYVSPNNTLQVWRLPDSAQVPTGRSYPLTAYPTAGPHECRPPGPTVGNPCGDATATTRPEMGWLGKDDFGWFWNVPQGEGFNYPHLKVARFGLTGNRPLIEETDVFNQDYAWHYGSVGVNERGDKGVAAYAMGGTKNPIARARVIDDKTPAWAGRHFHEIVASDDGVDGDHWGDYGAVRGFDGCPNMFGTSVYSMQGGGTEDFSEHRFAIFGRRGDSCFDVAWQRGEIELQGQRRAGRAANVRGVVRNTGSGQLPGGTEIELYASRDTARSGDDIRLDSNAPALPELGTGDGAGVVAQVTVPARARGSYHLIVCAKPPAGRQVSEANDCANSSTALMAGPSRSDIGIESLIVREPSGVLRTAEHAVAPRGTLSVRADLQSEATPRRKFVRFLLSRRAAISSDFIPLGSRKLGGATRGQFRRYAVRAKLRLPRSARAGGKYALLACATRSANARPRAEDCLPAVQKIIVKR